MVRTCKLGGILERGMSSPAAFRYLQCIVINIFYTMTRHTCAHTHTQLPQKDNFHHESTLLIHMAQSDIFNSILSYSVLFYFIKKKKRFIKSVL